ncbi:hypothetical protein MUP77_15645 [Candidatus Bathyarchaeota archaeon]|nr:hypothetical protein [Candidatus Bathyarchaeota archaeon]
MPALANTFLFVEPMQHSLDYGSVVLHQIVEANKRSGQTITELIGNDAYPAKVLQTLQSLQPLVFVGIGHGNTDVYSVESTNILVRDDSPELELFKDKVIDLCSCLTAVYLGPAIIDAGAVVYTGYKEEFWFFVGDAAGTTRAVQSPFVTEFEFVKSLLLGKSTGSARTDQLAKFDEEITYWTTGAGKDDSNSMELARILEMNKANSVFLGEGYVTPSPSPTVMVAGASSIPFALAAILLGVLIYREITA